MTKTIISNKILPCHYIVSYETFKIAISPWHLFPIEVLCGVRLAKQLKADDSKDVNNNAEDDGQVTQSTHSVKNNAEQETHGWPGLGQFEHPQLK